jgi:hypothetical protein
METRKLKAKDVIIISKIMKKININFSDLKIEKNTTKAGIEFAKLILEQYHLASEEINTFLADITGKTKKEIEELDLQEYALTIKDIFTKNNFSSFL